MWPPSLAVAPQISVSSTAAEIWPRISSEMIDNRSVLQRYAKIIKIRGREGAPGRCSFTWRSQLRWCFGCPLEASVGRCPTRRGPGGRPRTCWGDRVSRSPPGGAGGGFWVEGSLRLGCCLRDTASDKRIKMRRVEAQTCDKRSTTSCWVLITDDTNPSDQRAWDGEEGWT